MSVESMLDNYARVLLELLQERREILAQLRDEKRDILLLMLRNNAEATRRLRQTKDVVLGRVANVCLSNYQHEDCSCDKCVNYRDEDEGDEDDDICSDDCYCDACVGDDDDLCPEDDEEEEEDDDLCPKEDCSCIGEVDDEGVCKDCDCCEGLKDVDE